VTQSWFLDLDILKFSNGLLSNLTWLLINAGIVAGNSGGPVVDDRSKVIGIAVTGADHWQNVEDTENHGVVPIDALKELL